MTGPMIINPTHNLEELGQVLQQKSRLQITDFFTADSANYLHQLLLDHQHWNLAYNDGNNFYESPAAEIETLEPKQRHQFMNNIFVRARTQFQYMFMQYYISQAIELNEQPGHPMHQFHEFINSDDVLGFMRILTGEPAVRKADTYASIYSPGHFLTAHDDRHDKDDRVAAFVFSMTKAWDKNWGGHLAFFDDDGNIEQAFMPTFNTLNIFLV